MSDVEDNDEGLNLRAENEKIRAELTTQLKKSIGELESFSKSYKEQAMLVTHNAYDCTQNVSEILQHGADEGAANDQENDAAIKNIQAPMHASLLTIVKRYERAQQQIGVIKKVNSVLNRLNFDNPEEKVPDVKQLLVDGMSGLPQLEVAELKTSKLFDAWNKKFRVVVEDEDGIAVMNGADRPQQCPYTMQKFDSESKPMKLRGCGHILSQAGAEALLKTSSNPLCPMAGCQKKFTRASLELDEEFIYELKQSQRVARIRKERSQKIIDSDEE